MSSILTGILPSSNLGDSNGCDTPRTDAWFVYDESVTIFISVTDSFCSPRQRRGRTNKVSVTNRGVNYFRFIFVQKIDR